MSGQADEMRRRVHAGQAVGEETWERIDAMSEDPVEVLAAVAGCVGTMMGMGGAAAGAIGARQEFLSALHRSCSEAEREFLEGLATVGVGRG